EEPPELSDPGTSSPSDILTRPGSVVGTPAFMSPEQFRERPADARSDQFAFCVSLWQTLFGERPYRGAELRSPTAVDPPKVPRGRRVPGPLQRVLLRGLERDPLRRYPS